MDAGVRTHPMVGWTELIYGLHALSVVTGILTPALVVTAFLTGWPSIIAVVLNYIKRDDVRGTWLESHFRWQIRTFWYGVLWACLCFLFVVGTFGLGLIVVWLPLGLLTLWLVYRIGKGWMALRDGRQMYS
jgi:uncharacterized membrane protein